MYKSWQDWTLDQWLYHLEHRNTQEIQLGLSRIKKVAHQLQLVTPQCPVITVAGTNGKGSTVTALETIYNTAGYKTASYTSPHLLFFNERIKVNLHPVSNEDLCRIFGLIEQERGSIMLTYFEMATLAALWYFKEQKVDVILLEVGIGGRLDATNIIDADLSIITTIDYDHQDYLGTTLEAIGHEKAGILRPSKPFIYADKHPPSSIIKRARELSSPYYNYGIEYSFQEQEEFWDLTFLEQSINRLPKPKIQLKSASAALVACLLLQHQLSVTEQQFRESMERIFVPGRLQIISGSVDILYDVSHNAQSAGLLAKRLKELDVRNKIHIVFSALKDKDILSMISPMKDFDAQWYLAPLTGKRACEANDLLSAFKEAEIFVKTCYNSPLNAFQAAWDQAQAEDLIVVYGSFYTVSQVMLAQNNVS